VGSLGCALGEMVCGITIENPKAPQDERLHNTRRILQACRVRLVTLSSDDETAYLRFREAQAMPKSTEPEKLTRSEAMATTLLGAAEAPLQIAETSVTALQSLANAGQFGSRHALADVSTAAILLEASVKGALENVWVNLGMMKEERARTALTRRANDLAAGCAAAMAKSLESIDARGFGA